MKRRRRREELGLEVRGGDGEATDIGSGEDLRAMIAGEDIAKLRSELESDVVHKTSTNVKVMNPHLKLLNGCEIALERYQDDLDREKPDLRVVDDGKPAASASMPGTRLILDGGRLEMEDEAIDGASPPTSRKQWRDNCLVVSFSSCQTGRDAMMDASKSPSTRLLTYLGFAILGLVNAIVPFIVHSANYLIIPYPRWVVILIETLPALLTKLIIPHFLHHVPY
ncbi:hypothetical protein NM208_g16800 [Fusarium decemcellulare]|uniref:Uncharacterized protein n=1 Tax=Fusarium decemcellulare TaxID=57161 RepID=A0ACC1RCM7_9HYPO|nr:hypothetical protein NM208_g16800 [Fusarium decemcellulare]